MGQTLLSVRTDAEQLEVMGGEESGPVLSRDVGAGAPFAHSHLFDRRLECVGVMTVPPLAGIVIPPTGDGAVAVGPRTPLRFVLG